jgi:hypothetical protein
MPPHLRRGHDISAPDGNEAIKRTAADIMEDMGRLHQVLALRKGARKPERRIETPGKPRTEVQEMKSSQFSSSKVDILQRMVE